MVREPSSFRVKRRDCSIRYIDRHSLLLRIPLLLAQLAYSHIISRVKLSGSGRTVLML